MEWLFWVKNIIIVNIINIYINTDNKYNAVEVFIIFKTVKIL